tara:strand:- start:1840 stop:2106 length:267 start_codon:yes stop_codon:yes gene_type:complete
MQEFNYEYISHEDKLAIVEAQLRELESAHFSLLMIEPSRLTDSQAYGQWNSQKIVVEKQIDLLRLKRNDIEPVANGVVVPISATTEEE